MNTEQKMRKKMAKRFEKLPVDILEAIDARMHETESKSISYLQSQIIIGRLSQSEADEIMSEVGILKFDPEIHTFVWKSYTKDGWREHCLSEVAYCPFAGQFRVRCKEEYDLYIKPVESRFC